MVVGAAVVGGVVVGGGLVVVVVAVAAEFSKASEWAGTAVGAGVWGRLAGLLEGSPRPKTAAAPAAFAAKAVATTLNRLECLGVEIGRSMSGVLVRRSSRIMAAPEGQQAPMQPP